MIVPLLF